MGEGFAHGIISWSDLRAGKGLNGCEVLFINCARESVSAPRGDIIRGFVERGGSVYASDFAGAVIQAAFPEMLHFSQDGQPGECSCKIVDLGLRESMGPEISIHFDLGAWWQIRNTHASVRTYAKWKNMPIIVGFEAGKGHVIYTSFHNEAQVTKAEHELLRFLALRPLLAKAATQASNLTTAKQFQPGKEIIATANRSRSSGPFVNKSDGAQALFYVLQWEGQGTLRLSIRDPLAPTRST